LRFIFTIAVAITIAVVTDVRSRYDWSYQN